VVNNVCCEVSALRAATISEHLAGVEDFEVAEATYRAALKKAVIIRDRQDGV
jgi:hypothetical protein